MQQRQQKPPLSCLTSCFKYKKALFCWSADICCLNWVLSRSKVGLTPLDDWQDLMFLSSSYRISNSVRRWFDTLFLSSPIRLSLIFYSVVRPAELPSFRLHSGEIMSRQCSILEWVSLKNKAVSVRRRWASGQMAAGFARSFNYLLGCKASFTLLNNHPLLK